MVKGKLVGIYSYMCFTSEFDISVHITGWFTVILIQFVFSGILSDGNYYTWIVSVMRFFF